MGASLWFTTICALSVAVGALVYNLAATLSEFFSWDAAAKQPLDDEHVRLGGHGSGVGPGWLAGWMGTPWMANSVSSPPGVAGQGRLLA